MSILDTIGSDLKKFLGWMGSPKGQTIIGTGEAIVEDVLPAATGIINIANKWLTQIFTVQTLATQAGAQTGSNTEKASAVINTVGPEVISFAQSLGISAPTAAQLLTLNNLLVAFVNGFAAPGTTVSIPVTSTATTQVGVSTVTVEKSK